MYNGFISPLCCVHENIFKVIIVCVMMLWISKYFLLHRYISVIWALAINCTFLRPCGALTLIFLYVCGFLTFLIIVHHFLSIAAIAFHLILHLGSWSVFTLCVCSSLHILSYRRIIKFQQIFCHVLMRALGSCFIRNCFSINTDSE